jgi:hypothetical protein
MSLSIKELSSLSGCGGPVMSQMFGLHALAASQVYQTNAEWLPPTK